jgi:hypothetical protein
VLATRSADPLRLSGALLRGPGLGAATAGAAAAGVAPLPRDEREAPLPPLPLRVSRSRPKNSEATRRPVGGSEGWAPRDGGPTGMPRPTSEPSSSNRPSSWSYAGCE